jgi:hypothetical protein
MFDIFSKETINKCILIFIIIVVILLLSFSFYYMTPNNYIIHDFELINNIKPFKIIKIKISEYDKYILNSIDINEELSNMLIQIKTESQYYPIKLLISNLLKSQNLYVLEDTLIQSNNNSCITIINKNDKPIDLEINLFLIEEIVKKNE